MEDRDRRIVAARFARAMKVMNTAGYAAFGAAFFDPLVGGEPLRLINYLLATFGFVALSLCVWYTPVAGDDDERT